MTEAEGGNCRVDMAMLIESGGQSDRIWKLQAEETDFQLRELDAIDAPQETLCKVRSSNCAAQPDSRSVSEFGIQAKQQRTGYPWIKHVIALFFQTDYFKEDAKNPSPNSCAMMLDIHGCFWDNHA
jgi:hypothetical protein